MRTTLAIVLCLSASAVAAHAQSDGMAFCDTHPQFCTERDQKVDYDGTYIGHDEPSLLFYSGTNGSGNNNVYFITLPKDPPILPKQDGTGGTFNFQLRPAFWFGMAMCDTQSYPNFTTTCVPNTDTNIFDNPLSSASDWIGHHPGTAFMEMQFYPPGWVAWPSGFTCDAFRWCAALNIDSLSQSLTQNNNRACLAAAGLEYVNFAFITTNGAAQDAANPTNGSAAKFTPDPTKALFMNPGDTVKVFMRDTPDGFRVDIWDLNTWDHGSMTASTANGFAQVKFDPSAATCTTLPYAFHPMYATSSEHTRVPWAAHSYNIAFSDEIGHFQYKPGPAGEPDADDTRCFTAAQSTRIAIGGCTGSDVDFDGPVYGNNWPGTLTNPFSDHLLHADPVRFTSPLFVSSNKLNNYDRVAFETDLPRIEDSISPPCDRSTGANCVNPPVPGSFYPIYTTTTNNAWNSCVWQLGGSHILGTTNTFGGTSTAEYGSKLFLNYAQAAPPGFSTRVNDFRQVLGFNPCGVGKPFTVLGDLVFKLSFLTQ